MTMDDEFIIRVVELIVESQGMSDKDFDNCMKSLLTSSKDSYETVLEEKPNE